MTVAQKLSVAPLGTRIIVMRGDTPVRVDAETINQCAFKDTVVAGENVYEDANGQTIVIYTR